MIFELYERNKVENFVNRFFTFYFVCLMDGYFGENLFNENFYFF